MSLQRQKGKVVDEKLCYRLPDTGRLPTAAQGGGFSQSLLKMPTKWMSYLLFWLQSHPNTAAGCLYLWRILPSIVRMILLSRGYETCKTIILPSCVKCELFTQYSATKKARTYQNPSPLQVAILFESLWLHEIQNMPFLPCWGRREREVLVQIWSVSFTKTPVSWTDSSFKGQYFCRLILKKFDFLKL